MPSGLGQDPVPAPEHEVNIIQLGSGIETTIIFNSRTENPIIRSPLGQMGRQRRPSPIPEQANLLAGAAEAVRKVHNGGRGQEGSKVRCGFLYRGTVLGET